MSGTALIVAGTLIATVAAYLFQVLGGRVLGPTEFAPLTILWTVQFVAMHVLYQPLEQYLIRQMELRRGIDWRFVATAVGLVTVLSAVFVVGTIDRLFAGEWAYAAIAALMTLAYAAFAVVRARLAGTRRFEAYGAASGAEGVLRLLAAILLVGVGADAVGLAWALVIAPLAVLPWSGRLPVGRGREPASPLLLPMILAGVSAQLLIGAGPVAVAFLGASSATVSIVFVTFALMRGPLWILQGLFARVLPPLTALAHAGDRARLRTWSRRITGAAGVGSVAGGVVAAVAGPAVVSWLFGPEFRPSAALAGLVAAGMLLGGAGLLSNQVLIATGRTTLMAVAWTTALGVALLVLLVPASADVRVGAAFLSGQVVAVVGLSAAIGRVVADGRATAVDQSPVAVPLETRP